MTDKSTNHGAQQGSQRGSQRGSQQGIQLDSQPRAQQNAAQSGGGDILLDMRDVHIEGYADEAWHPIIKGVDLTLRRGEILGLIGESGAGKSTLGLAAMGFARPGCRITQGSIKFDGLELSTMRESQKRKLWGRRIAYVAQSAAAAFNPHIVYLIRQLNRPSRPRLGRMPSHETMPDSYQALQLPDPENIGNRYPHQVSGGQLQRVMTAMAMSTPA